MDKLQPINPNTVQAREMPNERTPLELAKEMVAYNPLTDLWRAFALSEVHRVAAALIERETPVFMTRSQINSCACENLVSGYSEDQLGTTLPNFCQNCGRTLAWK